MKYSCLVFSEGGKDKKFLMALIDLPKFKYYTKNWFFNYDNASGSSPEIILDKCRKAILGISYDLILCFIDLDKLKSDHSDKWEKEKIKLEQEYSNFTIIWQLDNAEDEYKKVLGSKYCSKHKSNQNAKQKVKEFINSDFWKKILKPIKDKERELKQLLDDGKD
ncbi:MAG: hypothetical protein V1732_02600 [Patescibacteria group bacterium]